MGFECFQDYTLFATKRKLYQFSVYLLIFSCYFVIGRLRCYCAAGEARRLSDSLPSTWRISVTEVSAELMSCEEKKHCRVNVEMSKIVLVSLMPFGDFY